ncbi:MAG: phosphopantothenoylcysteine decarboxylase, partial [Polymorphobacter sp.]
AALPADVGVFVAAVADWHVAATGDTIKKTVGAPPPALALVENPDILATVAAHVQRPRLVVGFAAETRSTVEHAVAKRARKAADWIVANDVSGPRGSSVMGGDANTVHLITAGGVEDWPTLPKAQVAARLAARIAAFFEGQP